VSARVGGKHYVIDTSRNGLGGIPGEWCNVPGQALGQLPTTRTGRALADAYLWVKYPGESDGTCNGGPRSGQWWGEYALGLAQRGTMVASAN
jgi:endoglucanase